MHSLMLGPKNQVLHFFSYPLFFFFFKFIFLVLVDESYGQGLLVLEQCLSTQLSEEGQHAENSMGLVLLAMSTLFSERFLFIHFSLVVDWYIQKLNIMV